MRLSEISRNGGEFPFESISNISRVRICLLHFMFVRRVAKHPLPLSLLLLIFFIFLVQNHFNILVLLVISPVLRLGGFSFFFEYYVLEFFFFLNVYFSLKVDETLTLSSPLISFLGNLGLGASAEKFSKNTRPFVLIILRLYFLVLRDGSKAGNFKFRLHCCA